MPLEVTIAGDGGSLTVEVLGYEDSSGQDISDANWLVCRVIVTIGAGTFSCDFRAAFTTHDFAQFREQLNEAVSRLTGMASFITDEDALRLSVQMGERGNAHVEGIARVCGPPEATLSFSFESDQSFLNQTLHALGALLSQFPIKEGLSINPSVSPQAGST